MGCCSLVPAFVQKWLLVTVLSWHCVHLDHAGLKLHCLPDGMLHCKCYIKTLLATCFCVRLTHEISSSSTFNRQRLLCHCQPFPSCQVLRHDLFVASYVSSGLHLLGLLV